MINLRFRTRMAFVISVFILAFVMDSADGQMCAAETIPTFPCGFGYSCMMGRKPYKSMGIFTDKMVDTLPFFELDNLNGMYCDCEEYEVKPGHEGMTDATCNTMFFRCPDNLICFHGAPCKHDEYELDGPDSYICDCSRSKNGFNLTLKGEHCEYQVDVDEKEEITDLVDITDPLCHPDDVNDATGLACASGYKCKVGEKAYKSMSVFTKEMVNTIPLFQHDNLDGRYCDCEENSIGRGESGMTGVSCSEIFTRCGTDLICLHGSACKYGAKEKGYMCDCAHTFYADITYMGNYCELQNKTYCSAPPGSDPKDYYCLNGGTCAQKGGDYTCECPLDALVPYAGDHCQHIATVICEGRYKTFCANNGKCGKDVASEDDT